MDVPANSTQRGGAPEVDVHKLLFRFTDRLYRARSATEVYDAALEAICEGLGCSRASILRFDEAGVMRFVAWRNLSDGYRAAVEGHSPWRPGDCDAGPICIEDIGKSDESAALKATVRGEGICGLAFIPLAIDDQVIGKFMTYYDTARLFTEQERELALTIARQLGFAMERARTDSLARRMAAIVDSSQDAIISKNLDGIITSWNGSAERMFGYVASEAIGQHITMLIPVDRHDEEPNILAKISAGERIDSYETVRQRKDGQLVDISLTVSPVRDASGAVIGASKIARDITDKRRTLERQQLLLREMSHRVKNLFALASSLVQLNARSAKSPADLAATVSDRLAALARAHSMTIASDLIEDNDYSGASTLLSVVNAILEPFGAHGASGHRPVSVEGDDVALPSHFVTPLALLFYELATNATKYGSLTMPSGRVQVRSVAGADSVTLSWTESGGPPVEEATRQGFGSMLVRASASQLGQVNRHWHPEGLRAEIVVNLPPPHVH